MAPYDLRRAAPRLLTCIGLLAVVVAGCQDPVIILGDLPGTMRRIAGIPGVPGRALDSLAVDSHLDQPSGIAIATTGTAYIADTDNARIVAVEPDGGITIVADAKDCPDTPCLMRPLALAFARAELLIADPGAHRIFRLDLADGSLTVVAGTGVQGSAPDGTRAIEAALGRPSGIAIASDGIVYFSERSGDRIRRIAPEGTLETVAGTGTEGFDGDGGPAVESLLFNPMGLAIANNTLYIADRGNYRIRAVDLGTGIIRTVAGNGTPGFLGDGGPAVGASLYKPEDVAVSADGFSLFIADTSNDRIRQVNLRTGVIFTYAGTGERGYNGELRPAGATALSTPRGVEVSPQGLLYIGDTGHAVVWRTRIRVRQ